MLNGYNLGIFPMGDDEDSISWFEARPRAILPVELPSHKIHITRSLSQVLKKNNFEIRMDTDFESVISSCAERESTWINGLILKAYLELFQRGYAHSVEVWLENELAGGLYGVAYKGAFFGESMFHKVSNASKVAVVKLYEILKRNKFILFDIQMMTTLFKVFGAIEVTKDEYNMLLQRAMRTEREFSFG